MIRIANPKKLHSTTPMTNAPPVATSTASRVASSATSSANPLGRVVVAGALAVALSARLLQQKYEHDEVASRLRDELARERAAAETYERRVRELERWRFWTRGTSVDRTGMTVGEDGVARENAGKMTPKRKAKKNGVMV